MLVSQVEAIVVAAALHLTTEPIVEIDAVGAIPHQDARTAQHRSLQDQGVVAAAKVDGGINQAAVDAQLVVAIAHQHCGIEQANALELDARKRVVVENAEIGGQVFVDAGEDRHPIIASPRINQAVVQAHGPGVEIEAPVTAISTAHWRLAQVEVEPSLALRREGINTAHIKARIDRHGVIALAQQDS